MGFAEKMPEQSVVALWGGFGGICMPLLNLGSDLLRGKGLLTTFTSLEATMGWLLGLGIVALVGAGVAVVMHQLHPYLKAVTVGLTLPAAVAALSHGAPHSLGQASAFLFPPAYAQSSTPASPSTKSNDEKGGQVKGQPSKYKKALSEEEKRRVLAEIWKLRLKPIEPCTTDQPCNVIFYDQAWTPINPIGGVPIPSAYTSEPWWSVEIPPNATGVSLLTPAGAATAAMLPPEKESDVDIEVTKRSEFNLGVRRALGLPDERYTVRVQKFNASLKD